MPCNCTMSAPSTTSKTAGRKQSVQKYGSHTKYIGSINGRTVQSQPLIAQKRTNNIIRISKSTIYL